VYVCVCVQQKIGQSDAAVVDLQLKYFDIPCNAKRK